MSDINSTTNSEEVSAEELSDDQLVALVVQNQGSSVEKIQGYIDDNQDEFIAALEDIDLAEWKGQDDGEGKGGSLYLKVSEDGLNADGESLNVSAVLFKYGEDGEDVEKEESVAVNSFDSAKLRELFPQLPAPSTEE